MTTYRIFISDTNEIHIRNKNHDSMNRIQLTKRTFSAIAKADEYLRSLQLSSITSKVVQLAIRNYLDIPDREAIPEFLLDQLVAVPELSFNEIKVYLLQSKVEFRINAQNAFTVKKADRKLWISPLDDGKWITIRYIDGQASHKATVSSLEEFAQAYECFATKEATE